MGYFFYLRIVAGWFTLCPPLYSEISIIFMLYYPMKNCYHIKISLDKTNPLIWREILVPDNYTFYQLHHTLQITMGWTNSHLFEFNIEGFQVGYVFDDRMEDISHVINCRDARLDELITHKGVSMVFTGSCPLWPIRNI